MQVIDYQPFRSAILRDKLCRDLLTDWWLALTMVGVSALATEEFLIEIDALASREIPGEDHH